MKRRNPFAVFILSIVTLGIYDIYWLVKTKSVLNKKTNIHTPTIWLLFLPILVAIVGVIVLLSVAPNSLPAYTTTTSNNYSSTTTTTTTTATSVTRNKGAVTLFVLIEVFAWLVILPVSFYWFFKFSKAISVYTKGAMSTGLAFIMLWLLHFIGLALVQDCFNDMPSTK